MSERNLNEDERADASRLLRADARRSRDALLEAAKVVFASSGVDAPVKEIADAAGVGVGTFYRRFPTRSDLILAIVQREVDDCAAAAQALAAEHPPFTALSRWIQRYVDFVAAKRGLARALSSGEPAYKNLPDYFAQRLIPVLSALLDRAAGEIRTDISAADLLRSVPMLCTPDEDGEFGTSRRMIALLINGLRRTDDIIGATKGSL